MKTQNKIKVIAIVAIIMALVVSGTLKFMGDGKRFDRALEQTLLIIGVLILSVGLPLYLRVSQRGFMRNLSKQRKADADAAYAQRRADAHADYVQRKADADAAYVQRRADAHADTSEREHKARVQMLLRLNKDGESMEQTLARLSAREAEAEEALKNFLSGHTPEEVDALLKEKLR